MLVVEGKKGSCKVVFVQLEFRVMLQLGVVAILIYYILRVLF